MLWLTCSANFWCNNGIDGDEGKGEGACKEKANPLRLSCTELHWRRISPKTCCWCNQFVGGCECVRAVVIRKKQQQKKQKKKHVSTFKCGKCRWLAAITLPTYVVVVIFIDIAIIVFLSIIIYCSHRTLTMIGHEWLHKRNINDASQG